MVHPVYPTAHRHIGVGLAINRMKKIGFYRHHDTMRLGFIYKIMYLFPITFVNFQTRVDVSILLNAFFYIIIMLISKIDEEMKKKL